LLACFGVLLCQSLKHPKNGMTEVENTYTIEYYIYTCSASSLEINLHKDYKIPVFQRLQ
jgi:hypothetical protein